MNDRIVLDQKLIESRHCYHCFKRIFDILMSSVGLIVLSPLMLLIAILIKCEDGGPVIYKQKRVGKHEKIFRMYKFRSMVINADSLIATLKSKNEVKGAMFKIKDDPRVTKIGHFLRKHSLDELPQLINVLLGNMSLVGPRPPIPSEVRQYTTYDKQRLYVVPGCTGLWQATERNSVGFNEMVKLDLIYIQKASFLYDSLIIIKTVFIVVKPNSSF